ncbi:MAG: tRNA lysidine(34) synthetase TilS [bacterium]|nr:tRNA lysidine(34) synthetase TilS [bacterium]
MAGPRRSQPRTLLQTLQRFFARRTSTGDLVLVAFSGGPDSTALLWGLGQVAGDLGIELHAAHLDHRLDPDSGRRANAACKLADEIGVPLTLERLDPDSEPGDEGVEAFARDRRYEFLDGLADRLGARFVATAHHADDQAETVLLRMLYGSGLDGLGAMREVRGRLVRPLLGASRGEIRHALDGSGLEPVTDPTNLVLSTPRNAIRERLLPHLESAEPGTAARLVRLATAARGARRAIERRLLPVLSLRREAAVPGCSGAALDRRALQALPAPLVPAALGLLHAQAGARYPASAAARSDLLRQLHAGGALGCDCGRGWRWEGNESTLRLVKSASSPGEFAYTLKVPGSVEVPELGFGIRLTRGKAARWMFRGHPDRAGLANIDPKKHVLVRNRRPGDRIKPLGGGWRRLKDLLIDRRVPRHERDRKPLLVIDGEIAWVPGVTIGERFRLRDQDTVWIAEIERRGSSEENPPPSASDRGSKER